MNEKRTTSSRVDEQETIINIDHHPSASLPPPPCYESALEAPCPPPSYLQSTTRLYYKNQPFISDSDQALYHHNHSQEYNTNAQDEDGNSESWSYIAKLPLHRRLGYYWRSWLHTVYDGRFVFFAFFVLASVIVLGLVVSFITHPNLFKHF